VAKRRKIIRAGSLVYVVIYSCPRGREPGHVRAAKQKCSTKARQKMNMKQACRKLELLLAANFSLRDLHVVLTYDEEHLPPDREAAVKKIKKFMVQLRGRRRALGKELLYVYNTEDKHGAGRLHHHCVINSLGKDLQMFRALWPYGSVSMERIDAYGYGALARYLTKEPREEGRKPGSRMWSASLNLKKPEVECDWVDDTVTLTAPAGSIVLEGESFQNEFGSFQYLQYYLPDYRPRKYRPARKSE
jgi:hypothetical protein